MKTIILKRLVVLLALPLAAVVFSSYYNLCDGTRILYPNPDDCSSFYECNGSIPSLKYCPNGLLFNPDIDSCDYPVNVDCDGGAGDRIYQHYNRICDGWNLRPWCDERPTGTHCFNHDC